MSVSLRPYLSLTDAISIIAGIVIGTAIFKAPPLVFANVSSPMWGLSLWLSGGLLSLIGACCYAELATAYPHSGGDYHYLTAAFGRLAGFLFGWAQLSVILTASIAQMAYVFADYAASLIPMPPLASVVLAMAVVVTLTVINILGITSAKWTQNVLTGVKILGLLGIVLAGFVFTLWLPAPPVGEAPTAVVKSSAIGLAMVFVLYAFGGWNDCAFVASEVHEPKRNIPKALWIGIGLVTALYLLVNAAYLRGLGFHGLRQSSAPAAELLDRTTGFQGMVLMSALVMISAAGAINGMILTGARVYARLGEDHSLFAWLGKWNERLHTPARSLLAQAAVSCLMIVLVGTATGRAAVDRAVGLVAQAVTIPLGAILRLLQWETAAAKLRESALHHGLPWEDYFGGFDTLVAGTAPVFWLFFLSTGVAFFVLRYRDPQRERPFRVPLYPLPPMIFCATCVYMFYSSVAYAKGISIIGFAPLAFGIPLYWWSRRKEAWNGPTPPERRKET